MVIVVMFISFSFFLSFFFVSPLQRSKMNAARGLASRFQQFSGGISALLVAGGLGYGVYNSIYTGAQETAKEEERQEDDKKYGNSRTRSSSSNKKKKQKTKQKLKDDVRGKIRRKKEEEEQEGKKIKKKRPGGGERRTPSNT